MRISSLYIFLLMLGISSGCAMPTTEQELVNKDRTQTLCLDQSRQEVETKVEERMLACFAEDTSAAHAVPGGVMNTTTSNNVDKNVTADGSVSFAASTKPAMNPRYYGFRVLIENGGSDCETLVTTHTMNSFWDRHSESMFAWLQGEESEC